MDRKMIGRSSIYCALVLALVMFFAVQVYLPGQAQAAMVVVDTGATEIWGTFFNSSPALANHKIHLWVTATSCSTPADTDTVATYTEAAGGGYSNADCTASEDPRACCTGSGTGECAEKTLTNGSWTVSTVSNIVQAAYATKTWTFTGSLTDNPIVCGYYITNNAGTTLILAEKMPATYTPNANGDAYSVTPTIQLSKGTPN